MKAGRELDALVAEKVMGWTPSIVANYPWQLQPPGRQGVVCPVPYYSTDIADAWRVFLRCCTWFFSRRRIFLIAIQEQAVLTTSGEVAAWPDVLFVVRHDFPAVICRAALAAVDVELPDTPLPSSPERET